MRLHTLGTCAGTEPMPTRPHASCVFEINGHPYWFDAGAGCSRTAALGGLLLTSVDTVFISHRHRDHTGGLPSLLWDIRKVKAMTNSPGPEKIHLHLPDALIWEGVSAMLRLDWSGLPVEPHVFTDGKIFESADLTVEARHNFHLEEPTAEKFTSYSFRITAEGKRIVYSGDVRKYTDMGDWLENCDLLMMETGHHKASEVCAGIRRDGLGVKKIMFVHSGREILNDYTGAKARAEAAWGSPVIIAEDGAVYDL